MARSRSKPTEGVQRPPRGIERRRAQRKRVLWSGQVESSDRLIDCAVLDISLQGARVRVDGESQLPTGPLAIAVSRFGTFKAEVVWSKDRMSGLRFLETVERVADTIGRQLPLAMVA